MNSTVIALGLVAAAFLVSLSLFVASACNAPADPQELEAAKQNVETLQEIRQRQSRGW